MRTRFALGCLALVAGSALASCYSTEVTLVGRRADGLEVVCTPGADGPFGCDPQAPEDGDTEGDGDVVDAPDGCSSWAQGGPAVVLWPPNHKLVEIGILECAAVRAECDVTNAALEGGRIVAVTSDEPLEVGAGGDGFTPEGDLSFTETGTVLLRSERQGGADGRVYRLEIEDANGERDACEVHVPHDQGPAPGSTDSGEQVRVTN